MQSRLEEFLVLFGKLKKETNDVPSNLGWLPKQKPYLAKLCYELDSCGTAILRHLSKKNTKHTIAPDIFSRDWEEYLESWKDAVAKAAVPEQERVFGEIRSWISRAREKAIAEGKTREDFDREFLEQHKPEVGNTFDPLVHDPADVMNNIKSIIYDIVDNGLMEEVFEDETIGAWNFFQKTVGIDYAAIYDRWRSAPELFLPSHTRSRNTATIIELYNEAVRAYVFGLTVASVAMCRALFEHILKKHYDIRGMDLKDIICIAEDRHEHLKGLKLQEKRVLGNTVLHKYEKRSTDLDKAVRDFLHTVRHLVTHIPRRDRVRRG
jgi:hypothetical protein